MRDTPSGVGGVKRCVQAQYLIGSLTGGWDTLVVLVKMIGWCGPYAAMSINCSRIQGGLRTSLGFDRSHQMSNTNFLDEANKALRVLPLLARLLGTHHGAP
jgi:hypothetical protein